MTELKHFHLGGHVVDAVDHEIKTGEKVRDVLRIEKNVFGAEIPLRIDLARPLRHDLGFGSADRSRVGDDLAVEIAHFDAVAVDKGDRADAAAHQSFRSEAADAADAGDQNFLPGKASYELLTEEQFAPFFPLVTHN